MSCGKGLKEGREVEVFIHVWTYLDLFHEPSELIRIGGKGCNRVGIGY